MSVGNISKYWRFAGKIDERLNSEQEEFIMRIVCEAENKSDGDITKNFNDITENVDYWVQIFDRFTIEVHNKSQIPFITIEIIDENLNCNENYHKLFINYNRRYLRTKNARSYM